MAFFDDGKLPVRGTSGGRVRRQPAAERSDPLVGHVRGPTGDLAEGRILLKIDVEGFEPEVLVGADNLLASGRVAALFPRRANFTRHPARAGFPSDDRAVEGHGYRIRWFPHLHMPSALIPWVNGNETGNLVA